LHKNNNNYGSFYKLINFANGDYCYQVFQKIILIKSQSVAGRNEKYAATIGSAQTRK
jgi:hypothetical protein